MSQAQAQPIVYLAGPITGLTFKGATDWREHAKRMLETAGIKAFSPMRCKEYLDGLGELSGHGREYGHMSPLSSPRGIITRDFFDATRCNVLLVNLLGADRVSIGTMFEMAWAFQKRTPIVCVMETQGGQHDHMFVREVCGFILSTLDEALLTVKAILA